MVYAGKDQPNCVEEVDVSRLVEEMLELLKVSISNMQFCGWILVTIFP
jgi:hypothetical protein